MTLYIWITIAYLCGSIPFGKLVGRMWGVDIQKRGSGNIGFANVRRVLGWRAGLLTLVGDVAKGYIPAQLSLLSLSLSQVFWVGIAAVLGHMFPLWLRFKGGKGVATAWGVLAVIQPIAALIGGGVYAVGCTLFKRSSTGSLLGAAVAAGAAIALEPQLWWQFMALLLLLAWALRHNIRGTVPNHG